MAKITVSLKSGDPVANPLEFQVEVVDQDNTKTTHQVTASQEMYQSLTGGLRSPEELVKSSFEFLLEKERKEQILPSFDLTQIKQFFPEYEVMIAAKLAT